MRKKILKSKVMLIALASILFVSCGGGGGGGGGGSSNLPLNPGTPSIPSTPSTPSVPEDNFPTVANPLDSQKGNISALKEKLNRNRENSTATIPTETISYNGSTVKIGILDSDFTDPVRKAQLSARYPGIEFIPRVNSDTSTSSHGVQVLEVMMDTLEDRTKGKAKFKAIAASIGNGGASETNKSVNPNVKTYEKVFERFNFNQKVKVVNQSFGADITIEEAPYTKNNIRNYVWAGDSKPFATYFEEKVNNDGGLFVWAAGNRKGATETNPGQDMDSVGMEAGLPYLVNDLEKGWIAVVGIQPKETVRVGTAPDGTPIVNIKPNGKLNIHRTGTDRLAYAGDNAKYWSISADDSAIPTAGRAGIGSSYAAPRVSRAAALVAEKFDWMTADQVRQTLFTTTDDTELDASLAGNANAEKRRRVKTSPDYKYGWGMLNQERALKGPGAFMDVTKYGNTNIFNAEIPAGKTSYFENKIFGFGGLVKSGEGTLHLTNDNSYAGGSVVNRGTLEIHKIHSSKVTVNQAGRLVLHPKALIGYNEAFFNVITTVDPTRITTGTNLRNKGIVEVNGTTAIIGGDYIAYKGSTTTFNNGAKLNVLGNIKVEDGTVKVLSDSYVTTQGSSNTVMEGKSVQGNIANVETNGMRNANVEVQDGKVVARLSRQNPVEYIGKNAEASTKNVAENVENVFQDLDKKVMSGTATKEELAMGAIVQNMTTMGFTSATEMMSGEIYASAQALTFSQAQNINRDLSNRLAGLDNFKNSNKDSEVWFSAIGSGGKLKRDGYASADTRVTGGQFGIDTKYKGTTTLGVAMNYSYAKANFNRYAGESKSDMVGVSFYAKQDLPYGFYTAGRLGLSNISSKVERELLTSTGETVTGKIKHHDKMLSAYVEIGKKFGWFTPFIGYSQDYLRRGSFNESEASWGVKADRKNYRATNFLVGARAEYVGDRYKLQAYVTQAINTDKRDLSYEGRFTGSAARQKFYGVKQSKNTTWIGFGAFREISPVFGVYGNVDFRVEDKKWADSVISTGLQYRF
ncbi:autotransporter serine protease fusolisin [Fusobacterium nucleatum]|uniref:Fusolisin n=1 Tax=Fusobacterium nucleatum subsp. nucleatum (strain ATCC 25586 / DSM 15643 / BCRC 10681 / CIP 101130 / JCM 8532 / KCTC 2640 / LMG 13131 / VPI 4355) TaxID=190304 RepID=A0A068B7P9_FUSNN|nr:autotransporter serine protease fusolisin [Fusobacterium nucleatum]AIC79906.1 fusolisin [Fusobacterium nucleatum subsp. nucleatum ATCC 25586]WMS28754.1 autotransporter serine protease fusolisin [Fusobacterium nucleatum]